MNYLKNLLIKMKYEIYTGTTSLLEEPWGFTQGVIHEVGGMTFMLTLMSVLRGEFIDTFRNFRLRQKCFTGFLAL